MLFAIKPKYHNYFVFDVSSTFLYRDEKTLNPLHEYKFYISATNNYKEAVQYFLLRSKGYSNSFSGSITISMYTLKDKEKFSESLILRCLVVDALYRTAMLFHNNMRRKDEFMNNFDNRDSYFFRAV
jgi:hypothetical protein